MQTISVLIDQGTWSKVFVAGRTETENQLAVSFGRKQADCDEDKWMCSGVMKCMATKSVFMIEVAMLTTEERNGRQTISSKRDILSGQYTCMLRS